MFHVEHLVCLAEGGCGLVSVKELLKVSFSRALVLGISKREVPVECFTWNNDSLH